MATTFSETVVCNAGLVVSSITLPANAVVNATITAGAEITRSKLALETKKFIVPLESLRVWDAMQTNLPGTGASDDLAYNGGTFATSAPTVRTDDVKNATTTRYARFLVPIPAEYENGGTLTLRASAGMVTTVASSAATVDFQVYKLDKVGSIGSDLVSTAATSINSLTFGDKDFTITPTGVVTGDYLDVRVAIAVTDVATGTAVIGCIGSLELLAQVRG
jgi:hypothetical protein